MSPIALANAGGKGGEFFGTDLTGAFAAKTLSHGIVGGVMSVLQGGKFGHGFASAGVTQAFAGKIGVVARFECEVGNCSALSQLSRLGTIEDTQARAYDSGRHSQSLPRVPVPLVSSFAIVRR